MTGPYTPEVHVEFAFGVPPMTETVDADFVEPAAVYPTKVIIDSVTIGRGRPSEFDTFQPGTCQINIRDSNRILDPQNTAGPYYGDLKPRVPVRVRGKIGATFYPRFYGFVEGWPMQLGMSETVVNIVATDAFKLFAGMNLPDSAYDGAVLADDPHAYWRLGEQGEKAVDSGPGHYDGQYVNVARGEPIVPYGNNGSAVYTGGTNEAVYINNAGARVEALPVSVDMWVQFEDEPAARDGQSIFLQPGTTAEGFGLYTDTDIVDGVVISYATSGADDAYSTFAGFHVDLYDGLPHHIAFVIDTGRRDFYFDGNPVTRSVNLTVANAALGVTPVYIGSYVGTYASPEGRISNVAVYDTALSAADVLAHYETGGALSTNTTGDRVTEVLDLIGWPAAVRAIDTGEMVLAPATFNGRNALDYLRAVNTSEQGRLFMARDGKVTFHGRDRFITHATETTSQFVFSDDGAGDALHAFTGITLDERFAYNEAKVTREGGNTQTSQNATAIAEYGPITRNLDGLLLNTDASARALGDSIVFLYGTPQPRAGSWSLQPEVDAVSFADVFDIEIGHRVTVEATPAKKGTQLAIDVHVEQINESITPYGWELTFAGSPVDPYAGEYFRFNGDGATQGWNNGVWR